MPLSSHLAPGFIRLTYSGAFLPHHQIIPINFSGTPTPGVEPELSPTGGTPVLFTVAVDNYVADALAPSLGDTTKVGLADIYAVDPTTGVRTFIYTYNAAGIGTSINDQVPTVEAVWVFKSTVGKPIKVYVMEGVYEPDARNVGTVPVGPRQDMIDYILSADNIFYGRTNAYPLAFSTFTSKVNDVLRRRQGFSDV